MSNPDMKPFTTVFRAAGQPKLRRKRPPVSCTACQRRKLKCDRQQPCGSCMKRGGAAECLFGPAGAGRGEVQARLSKLEEMVRGFAEGAQARQPDSGGAGAGETDADRQLGSGRGAFGEADGSYHGATSWAALVDSIHDIQEVLDADEYDRSAPDPPPSREVADICLGDVGAITIEDVVSSFPARQDADRLVQAFFNAKFLPFPFLHTHQFRRWYDAFWERPSSVSFLQISIIFSVLSAGCMVSKTKSMGFAAPELVSDPEFYMSKSAQCLVAGDYLKAGPLSVEALLAHSGTWNVLNQDSDAKHWSIYGLIVRLAQRRGYHRDAAKVSAKITPFQAEMRRRTWFTIQAMDLLFSFQHGMPPTIYEEVCDTGLPTNLSDDDFDEDTVLPPERLPSDPTPILGQIVKAKLCLVLRRIIRHALSVDAAPYSRTLELHRELQGYHSTIPACMQIRSIRSTSFTDANYTIMQRLILELSYLKGLCVLHRPFLTVGKANQEYHQSREICRDAALRSVELHVELDEEIKPGGRMHEDRYMVSSLTLHNFLIAAMVVCVDLSESTDISPEDRAHRIGCLQTCYGIWSERSAHSRDALHASRVLRAILNKVADTPSGTSDSSTSLPKPPGETTPFDDSPAQPQVDAFALPNPSTHEYHMDFEALPHLDSLGGSSTLDWNSLDNYLRLDPSHDLNWDPSNFEMP